ncbi:MAG: NERD domain-containing protein, partial [Clostridia bacterium]|nr:NERD domain-containing protein [Clostridia bacterium]
MSFFFSPAVIAAVIIIIAIVIIAAVLNSDSWGGGSGGSGYGSNGSRSGGWRLFEPEYKRAGRRGEAAVAKAISGLLGKKERLFTNVSVTADGGRAELDNIVVNRFGVFIIEVKNYNGYIVGGEDDYEWRKYKTTSAGNTYESSVKNPI